MRALGGILGLAACTFLGSLTAIAEAIPYTFTGAEGGLFGAPIGLALEGGFHLDSNAVREGSTWGHDGEGTNAKFSSPLQQLWGSYGDWTFSGVATVFVSDGPEFWSDGQENLTQDHWIVRASISGPAVNNLTPYFLSLFYYASPATLVGTETVFPPQDPLLPPASVENFQFALSLMNGNGDFETAFGQLFTIQSIPEPSSAMLLAMAIGVLTFHRRFR